MKSTNTTPLAKGTRIRFTQTLEEPATEDYPPRLYARAGELGTIEGHGTREGYWVSWDGWKPAGCVVRFGASDTEFEVI